MIVCIFVHGVHGRHVLTGEKFLSDGRVVFITFRNGVEIGTKL